MGAAKILVIGGTGFMGKFVVEASVKAGHPTFVLVRDSTLSNPQKSTIINHFKTLGVNILLVRKLILMLNLKLFFNGFILFSFASDD